MKYMVTGKNEQEEVVLQEQVEAQDMVDAIERMDNKLQQVDGGEQVRYLEADPVH